MNDGRCKPLNRRSTTIRRLFLDGRENAFAFLEAAIQLEIK